MLVPIWKFIGAKKTSDGHFEFNLSSIEKLKDEYIVICQENGTNFDPENDFELDNDILTKLIKNLELINNETTQSVIEALILAKKENLQGIVDSKMFDIAELSIPTPQAKPSTGIPTKFTSTTTDNAKNIAAEEKTRIICIIHSKSTKKEVEDFFSDFLFRQIQNVVTTTSNEPIRDGKSHPLSRGSLLDLFIRQQLDDRGDITSMTDNETRYRLVEPVSLSDEFESWTFDHFRGLFNIWISLDDKSEIAFPKVWKFSSNGQIDYIVTDHLFSKDDNPSKSQSERPSTKSLPNFIHDICRIEGNGKGKEWLDLLAEENITTYGHLSNLNQQEWSRMDKLRMNALKTIKFYVDQAKQMVEERKVKKTPTTSSEKSETYSKSEILADLHMIKLYLNYQLANEEGLEPLPQLEQQCVELAFAEIGAGGYEEDGLFDQMKLFFQPLTVKDDELKLDDADINEIENSLKTKSEQVERDIIEFESNHKKIEGERETILDKKRKCEAKREASYNNYIAAFEDEKLNDEERDKLTETWASEEEKSVALLDTLTVKLTEKEKELQIIGGKLKDAQNELKKTQDAQGQKNTIERKMVKIHRGFIMYGPPGTGKSVIMTQLAKKIGIAMLGPPLAAGELERPLVGQSEAVIADLCMRGNRLPHLLCCVSIDEIDSLAPKRDEDSSEGKVAKISVLLSVIEGIKDVKNLMFFSATNRLHMMDEAFLRRMSGKFFVGRPSAIARERILNQVHSVILRAELSAKLAIATTNFSGAALRALTSAITVHYLAQKRIERGKRKRGEDTKVYVMSEEEVLKLADQTARQYQIFLGLDTLPRLFLQNLGDRRRFVDEQQSQDQPSYHLPDEKPCTGKILISLYDRCVRIETFESEKERYVIERDLEDTEENLQQLLERITWYGRDRNVQLLQLIDLNLLSSRGAYEEKKIFETLKERYDECMEYTRSMIVYDLDSLVGVSESESDSSMGTSVSTSLVNQGVYIYITSRFREAKIEAASDNNKQNKESWAVAVVRNPFLLKKFTNDVDFALTETQKREQDEARRRAEKVLYCVKCRDNYTEDDNKMAACSYHDGFVYDNLSDDLQAYTPSQAIDLLNQEEYFSFKGRSEEEATNQNDKKNAKNEIDQKTFKDDAEKKKQRFKYICCHAVLAPGASFNGCKKSKHGWKDEDKYVAIAKKDEKDPLTVWENFCIKNKENQQRKSKLLKCREAYREKLQQSSSSI